MKIYKVSSKEDLGYDSYDSFIVSAQSEEDARKVHPSENVTHISNNNWMGTYTGGPNIAQEYLVSYGGWIKCSDIHTLDVEYIGETNEPKGVILASYNAG